MSVKDFHLQGMTLRESGDFEEAVAVLSKAVLAALREEDYQIAVGALGDRALVWKHMFLSTRTGAFLEMFQADVLLMAAIAKEHDLSYLAAKADRFMGEVEMEKDRYEVAAEWFEKAAEAIETAEKGDFLCHLGEALYRSGKKEGGVEKIEEGIRFLKDHKLGTDSFLFNVWLSGAYLRLAALLRRDDNRLAQEYINKAREVIESDHRLVLRKRRLEELGNMMR